MRTSACRLDHKRAVDKRRAAAYLGGGRLHSGDLELLRLVYCPAPYYGALQLAIRPTCGCVTKGDDGATKKWESDNGGWHACFYCGVIFSLPPLV